MNSDTNIRGFGMDLIEIDRLRDAATRNPAFTAGVFTPDEIALAGEGKNAPATFAGRWAAKEAVMKALTSGIEHTDFVDIEILRGVHGEPLVRLHRRAAELARNMGVTHVGVTITHTRTTAAAMAHLYTMSETSPAAGTPTPEDLSDRLWRGTGVQRSSWEQVGLDEPGEVMGYLMAGITDPMEASRYAQGGGVEAALEDRRSTVLEAVA